MLTASPPPPPPPPAAAPDAETWRLLQELPLDLLNVILCIAVRQAVNCCCCCSSCAHSIVYPVADAAAVGVPLTPLSTPSAPQDALEQLQPLSSGTFTARDAARLLRRVSMLSRWHRWTARRAPLRLSLRLPEPAASTPFERLSLQLESAVLWTVTSEWPDAALLPACRLCCLAEEPAQAQPRSSPLVRPLRHSPKPCGGGVGGRPAAGRNFPPARHRACHPRRRLRATLTRPVAGWHSCTGGTLPPAVWRCAAEAGPADRTLGWQPGLLCTCSTACTVCSTLMRVASATSPCSGMAPRPATPAHPAPPLLPLRGPGGCALGGGGGAV